ncbi:MAG: hypothetical protein IKF71_03550 [Bacilli bacterium]|nr:hypothetical protein [Bacilli bacterium]
MKRIIILLIIPLLLIWGCEKKETNQKIEEKKQTIETEEIKPDYEDKNQTPIGIYQLNGNTLNKLSTIHKTPVVEEDLGIFQIYPSQEENISLDSSFADSYFNHWQEYKKDTNLKVGFNLKFHLNKGEDVSYNIFSPNDCMNRWEHLMNYLYDDYANKGKGFYSHIENNEYNENTLFTAIKIQSSYQVDEIDSKILLTVFTYDTEDDFDESGEYRGNSSYTMTICLEGREC